MLFKTHLAFIIILGILSFIFLRVNLFFLVVLLIASLIPDLDIASSKLSQKIKFNFISFFLRHRGILHSLTFCIFILIILLFFWNAAAFPFLIGYLSHLILDAMTVEGIQLFWPFKLNINGKIKVGKLFEKILFFIFLGIIILLIVFYLIRL